MRCRSTCKQLPAVQRLRQPLRAAAPLLQPDRLCRHFDQRSQLSLGADQRRKGTTVSGMYKAFWKPRKAARISAAYPRSATASGIESWCLSLSSFSGSSSVSFTTSFLGQSAAASSWTVGGSAGSGTGQLGGSALSCTACHRDAEVCTDQSTRVIMATASNPVLSGKRCACPSLPQLPFQSPPALGASHPDQSPPRPPPC